MIKLLKWQELPSLDLYLDQVLIFVNQQLSSFTLQPEQMLTASMINNYVKHGIIPKPIKKKYNQKHLAYLISITLLKTTFNIQDISSAMQLISAQYGPEKSYDYFVIFMESVCEEQPSSTHLSIHQQLIYSACQTMYLHRQSLTLLNQLTNKENEHDDI